MNNILSDLGLKGLKNENKILGTNSKYYATNFRFLFSIARDRYRYENTDGKKDLFDFMEKIVVRDGKCMVYDHPTQGLQALRGRQATGRRTIYGKPSAWILYDFMGRIVKRVEFDDPRVFVVFDDPDFIPLVKVCHTFAAKLSLIDDSMESNLIAIKKPFIISAKGEQLAGIKDTLAAFVNDMAIVEDSHIDIKENIKVFDLKAEIQTKELRDERERTFFDFLRQLGYTNQVIDKRERLVAQEAENGFDVLMAADIIGYQKRQELIDWLKNHKGGPKYSTVQHLPDVVLLKANDRIYEMGENLNNKPTGGENDFEQSNTPQGGLQ